MRKTLLVLGLVLVLGAFDWAALQKEPLLEQGTVMYLELAPVDPRAFLLGDYMDLDFAINREVTASLYEAAREARDQDADDHGQAAQRGLRLLVPRDGLAVVNLSPEQVASFVRLDDGSPLAPGEHLLHFRLKNGFARVAASSFFFQEGHAADYEDAGYGEIHVDENGRNLLTHLLDNDRRRIEPRPRQPE